MKRTSDDLEEEKIPNGGKATAGPRRPFAVYHRPDPGTQPDYLHPPYIASLDRAPKLAPIKLPPTVTEGSGIAWSSDFRAPEMADLTRQGSRAALGERIIISGRVLDENSRPQSHTLIELWQANAAGRYRHDGDQHDAPLDPNFTGCGSVTTDSDGCYRFTTIKPGSYPWRNHYNAWRPAHIHFSLFGPAFATRLITQIYFPGDPLLPFDPIFNCTADEKARARLISHFDWENVQPDWSLAYRFDIVLRGREETPFEGVL